MSKFITVEGLEGAGKSHAVKIIKKILDKKGIPNLCTREPGGTFISEEIRNLIIKKYPNEVLHPETELLLVYAARAQHVNLVIKPKLLEKYWVISDRFNWSSFAYQGGGRKIDLGKIRKLDDMLLYNLHPNLIIYLDIEPEIGLSRLDKKSYDRFEIENIDFFKRSRREFLKLAKDNSKAVEIIDANKSLKRVEQEISKKIISYLNINKKN